MNDFVKKKAEIRDYWDFQRFFKLSAEMRLFCENYLEKNRENTINEEQLSIYQRKWGDFGF